MICNRFYDYFGLCFCSEVKKIVAERQHVLLLNMIAGWGQEVNLHAQKTD